MFKNWKPFEKWLLIGNIILTVLAFVIGGAYGWLEWVGAASALTNIVCVILCARRAISNYYWGIPAVLSYGIVSLFYGNLGEATLNLTYYLFMQFYGIAQWNKHLDAANSEEKTVVARRMTLKQSIITYSLLAIATAFFGWVLMVGTGPIQHWFYGAAAEGFGYSKFLLDSATTVFSIFAMWLMVKCYVEQWWLWLIIDIGTVILWTFFTPNVFMVIQWLAFTINAGWGLYTWEKNVRTRNKNQ